jgi:hypothetical protein
MEMFGVIDLERSSKDADAQSGSGMPFSSASSYPTPSAAVFVCHNLAFQGDYTRLREALENLFFVGR